MGQDKFLAIPAIHQHSFALRPGTGRRYHALAKHDFGDAVAIDIFNAQLVIGERN